MKNANNIFLVDMHQQKCVNALPAVRCACGGDTFHALDAYL